MSNNHETLVVASGDSYLLVLPGNEEILFVCNKMSSASVSWLYWIQIQRRTSFGNHRQRD